MAMIIQDEARVLARVRFRAAAIDFEFLHGGKLRIARRRFQDIGLLGGQGVALGKGLVARAALAGLLVLVVLVLAHGASSLIGCVVGPLAFLVRPGVLAYRVSSMVGRLEAKSALAGHGKGIVGQIGSLSLKFPLGG